MGWAEGFIAADWGTTNRRAYLVEQGACVREFEDSKGVLSVPPGGFAEAVGEIRAQVGDRPLLLAGMIGSNRGWVEAPYVPCPAGIDDLAQALVRPAADIAVVPGVSYFDGDAADVMRGEEVQLLGAVTAGLVPDDCLVCHPGTHNKWARLERGRIASFRTIITGELFSLLKEHSILADLLGGDAGRSAPFRAGVERGLSGDELQADLFSVRARVLLGRAAREDAAAYTSGLLIGSDVRIGLAAVQDEPVLVMGRPELTALYAEAIRAAGRAATEVDGEQCFIAGGIHIAERIP